MFNRTSAVTDEFVAAASTPDGITGFYSAADFVAALERPRRIIVMVQAGAATDAVLESLRPLLDDGDLLIDCGNSNYQDTERRGRWASDHGLLFVGSGVSGGEEGARRGPSIMPGGDRGAWAADFSGISGYRGERRWSAVLRVDRKRRRRDTT